MPIPASIESFLKKAGAAYSTLRHPTAYTAQEGAALTHVSGKEWAKSVVCIADGQPVLAVLPANLSVDLERLKDLIGASSVRLAKEDEFCDLYPECETGAMPPLGPLYGQRVFVDERLAADPEIVFNAGTHHEAIRMRYEDFTRIVQPVVGDFGRLPQAD